MFLPGKRVTLTGLILLCLVLSGCVAGLDDAKDKITGGRTSTGGDTPLGSSEHATWFKRAVEGLDWIGLSLTDASLFGTRIDRIYIHFAKESESSVLWWEACTDTRWTTSEDNQRECAAPFADGALAHGDTILFLPCPDTGTAILSAWTPSPSGEQIHLVKDAKIACNTGLPAPSATGSTDKGSNKGNESVGATKVVVNTPVGSQFGWDFAVDGDIAIAGAFLHDAFGENRGAAWAFKLDGATQTWTPFQLFKPDPTTNGNRFGAGIAIKGNLAAITHEGSEGTSASMNVYEYDSTRNAWKLTQTLRSEVGNEYWSAVAITDDDEIILGAAGFYREPGPHEVRVLKKGVGGQWTVHQTIPSRVESGDSAFGYTLHVEGKRMIIGDLHGSPHRPYQERGGAHLYEKGEDGKWNFVADLEPDAGEARRHWGRSFAIQDNRILIGGHDRPRAGEVYEFVKYGETWHYIQRLEAPANSAGFGRYVDTLGSKVIVTGSSVNDGGRVYVYDWPPGEKPTLTETYVDKTTPGSDFYSPRARFHNDRVLGTLGTGSVLYLDTPADNVGKSNNTNHTTDGGDGKTPPSGGAALKDNLHKPPATATTSGMGGRSSKAGPVQLTINTLDQDKDLASDWLRVTLDKAPADVAWEDIQLYATTAQEGTAYACQTGEATMDGCKNPFESGETWAVGSHLYLPCVDASTHSVVARVQAQELWLRLPRACDESATATSGVHNTRGKAPVLGHDYMSTWGPTEFKDGGYTVTLERLDADRDMLDDWYRVTWVAGPDFGTDFSVAANPESVPHPGKPCKTLEVRSDGNCKYTVNSAVDWKLGGSVFIPCKATKENTLYYVYVQLAAAAPLKGVGWNCDQLARSPEGAR